MSEVVSVEAIIAGGKETVCLELRDNHNEQICLEPWQKVPTLPRFYKALAKGKPDSVVALTQCAFFDPRVDQMWHMKFSPYERVFTERSVYSDYYTFGQLLRPMMHPEEWEVYRYRFETLTSWFNLQPDVAIILDEKIEVAYERIQKRASEPGREMEKSITPEYLRGLRDKHVENAAMLGKRVVVMTNKSIQPFGPGIEWAWLPETPEARAALILEIVGKAAKA